jgi:hypothetical protein
MREITISLRTRGDSDYKKESGTIRNALNTLLQALMFMAVLYINAVLI